MTNSPSKIKNFAALAIILLITVSHAVAQRQMENLDRGVIAIRKANDSVYIGWRMLGTESEDIAFNLYRQSGKEKAVKLNRTPIKESTGHDLQIN